NGAHSPEWHFSKNITSNTTKYGSASPSLQFGGAQQQTIYSPKYDGIITQFSFFISGLKQKNGLLLVEGYNGDFWETIDTTETVSKNRVTKTYNAVSVPALQKRFQKLR